MDISEDILNVISKEDAVKLLMEGKSKTTISKNLPRSVAIVLLLTIGVACVLAAILLVIASPVIFTEYLIKKSQQKKELQDESSHSTD